MYGKYTDGVISKFLDEYSFDDDQLEQYRKARRLEILAEAVAIPFVGMGVYGGIAYVFILLNTALVPLEWEFNSFLLTEFQHIILFSVVAGSWILGYGSLAVSSRINEVVKESGISPTSYSKHRLVGSYRDFQSDEYGESMEKLSEFASKNPPLAFEIFAIPFEEFLNQFRLLSRVSKNPVPHEQQEYINAYVSRAESADEFDKEFISNTYHDFFGLLVEDIEDGLADKDTMYKIITQTGNFDKYREASEDEPSTPTYTDILYNVTDGLLPELKSIWVVYIVVLLLGVYLAQTSGVAAVVVVSVLLSAIQLYERRYS